MYEYYVYIWDVNNKEMCRRNIYNPLYLTDNLEKHVRKYLRAPSKFSCKFRIALIQTDVEIPWMKHEEFTLYGFDALVESFRKEFMYQYWGRFEYESSIGEPFCDDLTKLEKIDVYDQIKDNLRPIVRDFVYNYKKKKKEESK